MYWQYKVSLLLTVRNIYNACDTAQKQIRGKELSDAHGVFTRTDVPP